MRIEDLRSAHPSQGVRAMLLAEVAVYLAMCAAYIWLALPAGSGVKLHQVAFAFLATAFPIALNTLHGDRPRDGGVRLDNLRASARDVAAATAAMAAVVVVVGLASGGFHWVRWGRLAELSLGYLGWGFAQQYLLQAFAFRRLRQAGLPVYAAAVVAAAAFGMLHAPNWMLVGATASAGVVWCWVFSRRPNIITLGLAHGAMAVLLFHAWPKAWLQNLTIGPMFAARMAAGSP